MHYLVEMKYVNVIIQQIYVGYSSLVYLNTYTKSDNIIVLLTYLVIKLFITYLLII